MNPALNPALNPSRALARLPVPGRLFWKIFVSLWLAMAAIALAVDFAVDSMFQAELRRSPDLSIGNRAQLSTSLVAANLRHAGVEDTSRLIAQWPGRRDMPVYVVDEHGQDILGRPVAPAALAQALGVLENRPDETAVQKVRARDGRDFILFVPLALLPAADPHLHVYQYAESSRVELLAMTLASLLFAAGMTWYLFRPIHHLHDAYQRFAGGDLATRVSSLIGGRRDEIADLGRDFDDMAGRLQTTIEAKTRLLHDVSHELRSPLARMEIALALARQAPARTTEMFDRIAYEIGRLDRILGETLTLSRLEAETPAGLDECVNIVELLEDIVLDARFEAGVGGRRIELTGDGDIPVMGRGEMLRSALENVVRNAILHTPEGAKVKINVGEPRNGRVRVSICDGGTGIPESELDSVFEPFFRGRQSAKAHGYGLGLSIFRRAIEAHGGSVCAENAAAGGLCVSLLLPVTTLEQGN